MALRLVAGVVLAAAGAFPLFAADHPVGGWLVLLLGAPVAAAWLVGRTPQVCIRCGAPVPRTGPCLGCGGHFAVLEEGRPAARLHGATVEDGSGRELWTETPSGPHDG